MEERIESVYKEDPTYKASAAGAFAMEPSSTDELPDALRGEKWSFVQLPLSVLQEELELVKQASHVAKAALCSPRSTSLLTWHMHSC